MINQVPSRVVLWNVGSTANVVAMYALFALSLVIGAVGILRHVEFWGTGKPAPEREGRWGQRFFDLYSWSLMQRGVVRERIPAFAHTLVYLGFLVLLFTTTMVFVDHDLGIRIYQGDFYLAVTLLSDLLGFGLLCGCALFAHRRYIERADLVHNRFMDSFAVSVLALLVVQGFLLEGLRIHATDDPWALYSPVGLGVARLFWGISADSASLLHFIIWWFHTLTVFGVVAVLPYTKFFHIIASSANLYFRSSGRARGALKSPGDLEKLMEAGEEFSLGLQTIKDYTWKQLLDLDACTSCGRCQDACPAYNSGKPLSPKWMILDTRNHALALHADDKLGASKVPGALRAIDRVLTKQFFLEGSGLTPQDGGYACSGEFRAGNKNVQQAARVLGRSADDDIAGAVIDPNVFWSCTTCMACVHVCPVGIDHVEQIVENRRNMVLMRGEVPAEAQPTLRALEKQANPYGAPEDRAKWMEGLELPIVKAGDTIDYLYWVGCVSAFDPRKQKIARALASIMKRAGLSFGVLGINEGCSGDPARRLGEENLYQTMAKRNIEVLNSITFKTLVANCPHCFNTIKNEYPQFGNLGNGKMPEIIHHSVLLRKLLEDGRIKLDDGAGAQSFTFHDPCYLGRYNSEYEAPRETISKVKGLQIIEMEKSREKGMCCGAGGGHFWMDLKIGERVNSIRADQAAETGAANIATACPFCMQMLEDGVKLTNREDKLRVRDIAEVIAERMVDMTDPHTDHH